MQSETDKRARDSGEQVPQEDADRDLHHADLRRRRGSNFVRLTRPLGPTVLQIRTLPNVAADQVNIRHL